MNLLKTTFIIYYILICLATQLHAGSTFLAPKMVLPSLQPQLEQVISLTPDDIFSGQNDLHFSDVSTHLRNHSVGRFISDKNTELWLNYWVEKRKIARIFTQKPDHPETYIVSYVLMNRQFYESKYQEAMLPFENIQNGPSDRKDHPLSYMDDLHYLTGYVASSQALYVNASVSTSQLNILRLRSRIIDQLVTFHPTKTNELDLFLHITRFLFSKYAEHKHTENFRRLEQSMDNAMQLIQNRAPAIVVLASLLMHLPSEDKDHLDIMFKNNHLFSQMKMYATQAQGLIQIPFLPQENRGHHLQNYFHSVREASVNQFGLKDFHVQLLAFTSVYANLKHDNTSQRSANLQKAKRFWLPMISSKTNIGELRRDMEDLIFRLSEPRIYEALKHALGMNTGHQLEELPFILEEHVQLVKSTLNEYPDLPPYYIRARVKSLPSFWQKFSGLLTNEETAALATMNPRILAEFFASKITSLSSSEDPSRNINDFYGMQIVFEHEASDRDQEILRSIQHRFLTHLLEKFKHSGIKEKTISKKGYSESKSYIQFNQDSWSTPVEVQVMSEKDLSLYLFGRGAHWIYDLKDKDKGGSPELEFDDMLWDNVNGQYVQDYIKDEAMISETQKDYVFPVIVYQMSNGELRTVHPRLNKGDNLLDLASTSTVNQFNETLASFQVATYDSVTGGFTFSERDLTQPLKNGEVIFFKHSSDLKETLLNNKSLLDQLLSQSRRLSTWLTHFYLQNKDKHVALLETSADIFKMALEKRIPIESDSEIERYRDELRNSLHNTVLDNFYLPFGIFASDTISFEDKKELFFRYLKTYNQYMLNDPQLDTHEFLALLLEENEELSNENILSVFEKMMFAYIQGKQIYQKHASLWSPLMQYHFYHTYQVTSNFQFFTKLGLGLISPSLLAIESGNFSSIHILTIKFDPIPGNHAIPAIKTDVARNIMEEIQKSYPIHFFWMDNIFTKFLSIQNGHVTVPFYAPSNAPIDEIKTRMIELASENTKFLRRGADVSFDSRFQSQITATFELTSELSFSDNSKNDLEDAFELMLDRVTRTLDFKVQYIEGAHLEIQMPRHFNTHLSLIKSFLLEEIKKQYPELKINLNISVPDSRIDEIHTAA